MRPSSHLQLAAREKERRGRIKYLYSTLATLLHLQPCARKPLPELVDQATESLKHLKGRVERLKAQKEEIEKNVNDKSKTRNVQSLQMVQVREIDSKLEVIMVNNKKVATSSEVLRVIEEGGAQITSSSFSTVGHYIYCTIYAQAFQARLGFDAELIESKLLELEY